MRQRPLPSLLQGLEHLAGDASSCTSCDLTVFLVGSTFFSCNPLVTAEEGRRRREITGLLLHRDVRQVRPVAAAAVRLRASS